MDLKVKGIGLGSSYSQVIEKLGKPTQHITEHEEDFCFSEMYAYTLRYSDGVDISLIRIGQGKPPIVFGISVTSAKWSVSGISVGARMEDVQTKLGKPLRIRREGNEVTYFYDSKRFDGVEFTFEAGILTNIEQSELIC